MCFIKDNVLMWEWNHSKADSFFVRAIHSLRKPNSLAAGLIEGGFKVVMGSGDMAEFWTELKWDSKLLREAFSRMFALAVKKKGAIQDFRRWVGKKWVWDVQTRRLPFD